MVLHPEVYRKAQAEIDRVVGSERLPELEDRPSLPYLECVLKEVYRSVFAYIATTSLLYRYIIDGTLPHP